MPVWLTFAVVHSVIQLPKRWKMSTSGASPSCFGLASAGACSNLRLLKVVEMTADELKALKGLVDKLLAEVDKAKTTAEASLGEARELNGKITQIVSAVLDVFGVDECSFAVGKATAKLQRTKFYTQGCFIYLNNTCIFSTSSPVLTLMYSQAIASALAVAVEHAKRHAEAMRCSLERARSVLGDVKPPEKS